MNIKKRIPKFLSLLLCFSMTFGNMIPAYATENTNSDSTTVIDGENISTEERNLEDITVTYKQASSFFVTIPKTIVLDGWKQSTYAVKVSGDIDADQCVYVAPVDGIADTENIDFYMKDQASENAKDDVVANVTHNKFHWSSAEVAENHKQDDNLVSAQGLTAGAWKGIFQMEIKLETHGTHKHNYVDGACTICGGKCTHNFVDGTCTICGHTHKYADGKCECGAVDPNHTHNYVDGTCTICGGKCTHNFVDGTCTICGHIHKYVDDKCECGAVDPSHVHNFVDGTCTICGHTHKYADGKCECGAVDPSHTHNYVDGTCTICGGKCTHNFVDGTCTICGHTHKYADGKCECGAIDPNHTHNYEDGKCTICGKENDPYEIAPATAYMDWSYTLDNTNNIITLNYYGGLGTDVIVYANYVVNGKTYKTQLKNNHRSTDTEKYMFYGCSKVQSIKFSRDIDISNVTSMKNMFNGCQGLTSLDVSNFDTSNVTDMGGMFQHCYALQGLDVSNFDTSNVTNMIGMFEACYALTSLDVSSFDTSNVTNMWGMFSGCRALTSLDVSNFDTSKVTDMRTMFSFCQFLTSLDLSSFDTSNVTYRNEMFRYCGNLKTIYVSRAKWSTPPKAQESSMFEYCGTSSVTYK